MKVINGLCTQNYTYVECEDKEKQKFNAPHHFRVFNKNTDLPSPFLPIT